MNKLSDVRAATLMNDLQRAVREERIEPLELALADWCLRHGGDEHVALGMALAARAVAEGHSCLSLTGADPALPGDPPFCTVDELVNGLRSSPLVAQTGESRPLVLDGTRLYLHRYWHYESRLAVRLNELLARPPEPLDIAPLRRDGGLFDYSWVSDGATHWQAVAAGVALRHRFSVISGGPGTGKTYTVLRLIKVLIDAALAAGGSPPVIRLAAPTGKAAARMMDSVQQGLDRLPDAGTLLDHLPEKASTLHRLLGIGFGTVLPRYNREHPLAADVVIVDEASMVDLPLMAKLADALPDDGRLILLGDRYQLTSVESGSVLAELCAAAGVNAFSQAQRTVLAPLLDTTPDAHASRDAHATLLGDHVVTLQTSHRFRPDSPIGRVAAAVNSGDADAAISIGREADDVLTLALEDAVDLATLAQTIANEYTRVLSASAPQAALDALDAVRLLTATRVGPAGSIAMNQRIQERLTGDANDPHAPRWYHGRPVLVVQNDYRQNLFNGDTGVCLADVNGNLRVWFRTDSGPTSLLPNALPAHETAYAMTVHKSQGSEFDAVWLLLPPTDVQVLSRELVYTGITRARRRVTVLGPEAVFRAAVGRVIRRDSGLGERLAGVGGISNRDSS
jgi:exodeoxyribonuclease V alpha subunit